MSIQLISTYSLAQKTDCSKITTRYEVFNDQKYLKYNVSDSSAMRCPQVIKNRPVMNWRVTKTEWSDADENEYRQFIQKIGHSQCNTTDKCLSGSDNILRTEEDMLFTHYSDCADFPYYLRAYFAYKKNLPFSMVTKIRQVPFSQTQLQQIALEREKILAEKGEAEAIKYDARLADLRYSRNGNFPAAKSNVPATNGTSRDFGQFGPQIMDYVSSGTLRMVNGQGTGVESDFYSPVIQRSAIQAGTVLYSVGGHVAIVYDVTKNGEILYVDAHPDNSVTRGVFKSTKEAYQAAHQRYGGNFKNFRPLQVLNPIYDAEGVITQGQVRAKSDQEITQHSLEQYLGSGKNSVGQIIYKLRPNDSKTVNFNDWVKFKLSGGRFKLNPVLEMKSEMEQLCQMAKERVSAVQAAVDNKIHLKNHPFNLPENIYGADGEWEAYSSPGRDLRLKLKILEIPDLAKSWVQRFKENDELIDYKGSDLKSDIISIYKKTVDSCQIQFLNSQKKIVTLSLENLIGRVSRLSYDPYACPEIRWGAFKQEELQACVDSQEKMEWHLLQQFLRNNLEKDTAVVHGYTLDQLILMNERKEVDNAPQDERFIISSKLQAM